jgi:hypothetical protein
MKKSKLDFTKDKLKAIVLELANLNGYEKPSTYLDELLNDVKEFNDFEFKCDFFLNIHYLCKENSDKFWSESHKKDITNWLRKARLGFAVFNTTWEKSDQQKETEKPQQETSQPIPLEYMESYKEQMEKEGDEMFLSLMKVFKRENKEGTFFATELQLVNSQIRLIDDYIIETENSQFQRLKEYKNTNGSKQLTYGLKRLPDDLYLEGYRKYLDWLKSRKVELESGTDNKQSLLKKPTQDNKQFFQYLIHDKPKELADICKMLFNNNNSPKEYAIMFCLLTQNDLLNIPDRKRTDYFKAWYNFIEKPFPDRNNFAAINKCFLEINETGFLFDEYDYDYLKLKAVFEKTLNNKRII